MGKEFRWFWWKENDELFIAELLDKSLSTNTMSGPFETFEDAKKDALTKTKTTKEV